MYNSSISVLIDYISDNIVNDIDNYMAVTSYGGIFDTYPYYAPHNFLNHVHRIKTWINFNGGYYRTSCPSTIYFNNNDVIREIWYNKCYCRVRDRVSRIDHGLRYVEYYDTWIDDGRIHKKYEMNITGFENN